MKKKILLILIVLMLVPLVYFLVYQFIKLIDHKSVLSGLEKYSFVENEIVVKKFEYDNKNYVISMYYDDSSSWSHLNFLLKDNNNYYILEKIKKCDTSVTGTNLYLKDNELYIHCIGTDGVIDKYIINNLNIKNEKIYFNFKNTPDISQLHIGIDKVENEYIYLSSLPDNPKVKCSLNDKICVYY